MVTIYLAEILKTSSSPFHRVKGDKGLSPCAKRDDKESPAVAQGGDNVTVNSHGRMQR